VSRADEQAQEAPAWAEGLFHGLAPLELARDFVRAVREQHGALLAEHEPEESDDQ
jgi:uncharacterized membrane protein